MVTIFETLADYAQITKDTDILTEYVRHALARQISRQYAQNNMLTCITVDPQLENLIAGAVQRNESGSYVVLEPQVLQNIISSISKELPKITNIGYQPIILTSPAIRTYFYKLVERSVPNLIVLSYAELETKVDVQSLGMVRV
jgi:flagellar biosynthesis protein FlhA